MKKIQYALLLAGLSGLCFGTIARPAQGDSARSATSRSGRVILVSHAADDEPSAETQTVFRPVLDPEAAPQKKAPKRVQAKIFPLYNKLARGERCPVAIELTVQDGWHINASPANPDFLIPTGVTFKSRQKVSLKKTVYPRHKLHTMQQETEPYHVYDGKVMVYCLLEIDAREQSEKARLEFSIRYQACNDDQCEKPVTVVMKGTLPVADPGDDIKMIYQDKFPKPGKDKKEEAPQ